MKSWFSFHELVGANPGGVETKPYAVKLADTELILGFETAQGLGLSAGDAVSVNGQPYQLTGILNKSGGDEDRLIFANLSSVQSLLGYEGSYSMIEVSGFLYCPTDAQPMRNLASNRPALQSGFTAYGLHNVIGKLDRLSH